MLPVALRVLVAVVAWQEVQRVYAQEQCRPLVDIIKGQPQGRDLFGKALEASGILQELDEDKQYTVFLPANGSPSGGTSTLSGLFDTYNVDTTSVESIKQFEYLDLLSGFLKFYIVPGSYSAEELQSRTTEEHLRTLFDPEAEGKKVCRDPQNDGSSKLSDGDLKIEYLISGELVITDDSDNTQSATVTEKDIRACGGSYVHLIDNALNPCCSSDEQDCEVAPFEDKQINNDVSGSVPAVLNAVAVVLILAVAACLSL